MDCRMRNSKKGKYVVTGRPGQTSFTCLCVAQAKPAGMAAADNADEDEADTLEQGNDDLDTPADPCTNPEVKVEETYDTEMPRPATTLPESDGMGQVVDPEAPDDGEPHETNENAEIDASSSTAAVKDEVKVKIEQDAGWRDVNKVL